MRHLRFPFIFLTLVTFTACGFNKQRKDIQQEKVELRQRELNLTTKEQELEIREASLNERQKQMDKALTVRDTLSKQYPDLPGSWLVKMTCTNAGCPGSALGDTKVEQWAISFQNNMVVVKAMNNKYQLSRIYTGDIDTMGKITLTSHSGNIDSVQSSPIASIIVRMKQTREDIIEGERKIIQPDLCNIVYSLYLKKQN